MHFWFNGQLHADEAAAQGLSPSTGGLLLGLGVFSTIGIWNGQAFALQRHYARLAENAAALGLDFAFDLAAIEAGLAELIAANGIRRGMARLTLTARGDGRWNTATGSDLSILAQSLGETSPSGPLRLGWSQFRIEARRATAGIKTTSYADHLLAWREAQQRGLDEVILCNSTGALCEASRSNLFWTANDTLYTPALASGCLPGIARALVLEWARADGYDVREAAYSPLEVENATTLLLTNAAMGIRHAVLEGAEAHLPAPDALGSHLIQRWKQAVEG